MKLFVVGATGGIGQHMVSLALAQGHVLTAMVRSREGSVSRRLPVHENLTVVSGDVMDRDSVERAMAGGHDAVMAVLSVGGNSREPTTLYSEGTTNILHAMKNHGVQRYMGVSASGFVNDPNDPFLVKYLFKPMLQTMLKNPYDDLQRMEAQVKASSSNNNNIDWTLVRPARLVDGEATGTYRTALDSLVPGGSSIARGDVADFLVKHINDTSVFGKAVGIAY